MNHINIFSVAQLILALQAHFQIAWIIILEDEDIFSTKNLIHNFSKTFNFTYISAYDLKTFVGIMQLISFYQSAMVLSLFPNWMKNNSTKVWFWNEIKLQMSRFVWLSITNETNQFSDVYIPFDCEFLIADTTDHYHFKNFEVYRTGSNSNLYLDDFGIWDSENGLRMKEDIFDLRRTDLHGHELLVHNEEELPDDWFSVTSTVLFADACRNLGKRINAKIAFTHDENGPYDLNAVPNRIFPGQSLGPIFIFRYDIFFKSPSRSFSWVNYIKPYSTPLWCFFILTATAWSITLIFIYKSLSYVHKLPIKSIKKDYSIFEVIVADAFDKPPTYISATILFIFKNISRFILQNAYSATFMSFVIVIISKPPFTTLQGIVDNGNYKVLALPTRGYGYYELAVEDPAIREIGEKYLLPKEQQPTTYQEAFDLLCYSGENYVTDFPVKLANELRLRMKKCHISDVTIKLIYGAGSWYTKENSPFRRALNFWSFRLIEAGTLDPMVWSRSSSLREFNPKTPMRPIDIYDCGLLLIVLALGLCFSIIFLYFERLYLNSVKPKYNEMKKRNAAKNWKGKPFLK